MFGRAGCGEGARRSETMRHFSFKAIISLQMFFLAGCATNQPLPTIVKVPYALPCLTADQLPKSPYARTDAELAKMSDFDLVINISADRLEYRRYATEASAVLLACVK